MAVKLAVEDGVPSEIQILTGSTGLLHGKTSPPAITAPQAPTLANESRVDLERYDALRKGQRGAPCVKIPMLGALAIMLCSLKMRGMAQAVDELVQQGAPAFQAAIPRHFQLLKVETAECEVRSMAYQIKIERFPAYRDLAGFDFSAATSMKPWFGNSTAVILSSPPTMSCSSVGRVQARPISPITLGVRAIEHHKKCVRFLSTVDLVNALEQEKDQGRSGQLASRLVHADLVILDELGYLPFSTSGGAVLFHPLSKL